MEPFLIAGPIVFVAAVLQSSTGFGFSLMATPLLLLVYEPRAAIQLNLILSLVVSIALLPRIRAEIDRPMLRRFVKSGLVGIPLGGVLFAWLEADVLRLAVGVVALAVSGLVAARLSFAPSRTGDRVAGLFSGAFTSSLGIPGPPLLVYFAGTALGKDTVRGTTLAFFLFAYGAALLAQLALGPVDGAVWLDALVLLPAVAVGTAVGQALFGRISQRAFMATIRLVLAATGAYLLAASL